MLRTALACLAGAIALGASLPAHAVGRSIDVQVVDRNTGETLTPIRHRGEWWVAGRPGARYGIRLVNRDEGRKLGVVSVDGVNAISGDSAAWNQTGYVLDGNEQLQVDGWRKNVDQVASFEFTALPDSYAARTGRPANVGVIGIAVFNERKLVVPLARPNREPVETRAAPASGSMAPAGPQDAVPAPAQAPRADKEMSADAMARRDRLGTGHGELEASSIRYVDFRRANSAPNEIVTIHYDRPENLMAMGIMPDPDAPGRLTPVAANPFPHSARFVADPPPR